MLMGSTAIQNIIGSSTRDILDHTVRHGFFFCSDPLDMVRQESVSHETCFDEMCFFYLLTFMRTAVVEGLSGEVFTAH